jgi:hypothetical protein
MTQDPDTLIPREQTLGAAIERGTIEFARLEFARRRTARVGPGGQVRVTDHGGDAVLFTLPSADDEDQETIRVDLHTDGADPDFDAEGLRDLAATAVALAERLEQARPADGSAPGGLTLARIRAVLEARQTQGRGTIHDVDAVDSIERILQEVSGS